MSSFKCVFVKLREWVHVLNSLTHSPWSEFKVYEANFKTHAINYCDGQPIPRPTERVLWSEACWPLSARGELWMILMRRQLHEVQFASLVFLRTQLVTVRLLFEINLRPSPPLPSSLYLLVTTRHSSLMTNLQPSTCRRMKIHNQFVEEHWSRSANWHHVISFVDVKSIADWLNNTTWCQQCCVHTLLNCR